MSKILVVEDDIELSEIIADSLKLEHHRVEQAHTGREALDLLAVGEFDAIILDWELPEATGVEICQKIRAQRRSIPILMLTGRRTTTDKITGLDAGADDYVTKPCDVQEIAARIRALLRRASGGDTASATVLTVRNLTLDTSKYRVERDGQEILLLPIEYSLLEFFMRHPDQVFSHDALLQRVWPTDSDSTAEAVRSCIKRLRKKLGDDGDDNSVLQTVYGVGYRLNSK